MPLHVGDKAPLFELPKSFKERVSLVDFRGKKVVVVFYPYAFSGVCTPEMCGISEMASDFSSLDAEVLAISCDPYETLLAFAKQNNLQHTLLSDFWPHGEVAKQYGVFVDKIGAADRGSFIIDRDGVIAGTIMTNLGTPRDPAEYAEILKQID